MTQAPDCQFALVVVVSLRARQLMLGARPLVDTRARKATRIAEDELRSGYLEYQTPEGAGEPGEERGKG